MSRSLVVASLALNKFAPQAYEDTPAFCIYLSSVMALAIKQQRNERNLPQDKSNNRGVKRMEVHSKGVNKYPWQSRLIYSFGDARGSHRDEAKGVFSVVVRELARGGAQQTRVESYHGGAGT